MKVIDGSVKIPVERDEKEVGMICFNPDDIDFVESFYELLGAFEVKEKEFVERERKLEAEAKEDEHGIPANMKDHIGLAKEVCAFVREEIDKLFGEGTSQTVFGDYNSPYMFDQFFDEVSPYIKKSREEKVAKYTGNRETKRAAAKGKKVMK